MRSRGRHPRNGSAGVSVIEVVTVLVIAMIMTAIAVPVITNAMNNMRMTSMQNAITSTISKTRFLAIMNSQEYTLVITASNNTYKVTNVNLGTTGNTEPLPSTLVTLSGGTGGIFTYTFCPNGMVYGNSATCQIASDSVNNPAPDITISYLGRQIYINVSNAGTITTQIQH
jgi:Tfp pilus assembly protein PilV